MSPALAGGFLTTAPPGKPAFIFVKSLLLPLAFYSSNPAVNNAVKALGSVLAQLVSLSQQSLYVVFTDITHKTKSSLGPSVTPKGVKGSRGQKV